MLLTLFGIGKINTASAQSCGTGAFYQLDTIHWAALGQPVPPVRIFDNTGKEYIDTQLIVNPLLPSCQVGKFNLEFEDMLPTSPFFQDATIYPNSGLTLGEMRRNVVCQVFMDLSNFIADVAPINTPARVEIIIRSSTPFGGTAAATPFYILPNNQPGGLILDTEVQKTLLSGQNSYLQYPLGAVFNASLYHGQIEINPDLDWYCLTDSNNINPSDPILGGLDLYTVTLHEAIHLLGCIWTNVPPIGAGGAFVNFTRYHKFLQFSNQTQILSNSGGGYWIENLNPFLYTVCASPGSIFFNAFALLNQETMGLGLNGHHLRCEDPSIPGAYSTSSMGGHIPNHLVMSGGGLGPDFAKRHPAEEEKNLLCDLGYSFTPYTAGLPEWGFNDPSNAWVHHLYTSPCAPPCNIVSISDIYDIQCIPSILHITPLANDLNVSSNTVLSQIRILMPNANAGTIVNLTTTSFDFIPAVGLPNGWVVLSYVPVCGNGQDGGTAYIFINIQNNLLTISKTVTNAPITLGGVIDYEIRVCNPCTQGNVNGVVIEDVLDIDIFNIVSVQTTDFVVNGNVLTTPPMNLAPGCTTLHFSVNNNICETTTFDNTAAIIEVNGNGIPPISSTVTTNISVTGYDLIIPYIDGTEDFSDWVSFFPAFPNNTVYTVKIAVGNTLFINMPYHFQNIVFIMEYDSEITILDNAPTEMTDCLLYGCGFLWRGIKVAESAQFQLHHSIVRDAEYGIFINDLTKVRVDANSLLRNNYIGICVGESANTPFNSLTLTVENTIFEGAGNLLPSFSTPNVPIYNEALAGMYLNNLMFSMNNNVEFRHLSNGILGHNCELTLSKIRFKDIHDFPNSPYHTVQHGTTGLLWNGGAPIHYNGSAVLNIGQILIAGLTVTGAGSGTLPYGFEDCDYGIVTHNSRLKVVNNTMMDMGMGVHNFLANQQSIQGNTIYARFAGVLSFIPDFSANNEVANNFIHIDNPTGGASSIGIGSLHWFSGATSSIYGNSMVLKHAGKGIEVLNAEGIKVYQNAPINMGIDPITGQVPPFDCYGLHVTGTANGYFGCNQVYGVNDGNGADEYVGMHFAQSIGNTISCNVTDKTAKGIEFTGGCDAPDQFIGNEMKDHFWGMFLTGSGSMGPQDHTGNMWTGTYGNTAAENNGVLDFVYVYGTNPVFLPSVTPSSGWFIPDNSSLNVGCSATECGGTNNIIGSSLNEFDYKTANNEIEDSLYQVEFQYAANRHLYQKLSENIGLLPPTGAIHDFYTDNESSNVNKFSEVEQDQATIQNHSLVLQLAAIQEDIAEIKEQLRLSDSLFLATNDSSVLNSNDSLNIVMQNLQIQNISMSEQVNAYISSESTLSAAKNNAVIDSTLYESNEKQINEIYLATIGQRNYQFNSIQISIIDDIAHQCPYTGGKGVYKARAIYALFYPFEIYDDTEVCASQNVNWRKHNLEAAHLPFVNIYPNPAESYIRVDFATKSENIQELFLYDLLGRKVLYYKIAANEISATIPVQRLPKGIYQVNIISTELLNYTHKLVIE